MLSVLDPSYFTQKHPEFSAAGWGERYFIHMAMSCFLEPPSSETAYEFSQSELESGMDKADVTFYSYAKFGQKVATSPDFNAELLGTDLPFFVGPSFEGWTDGALMTPVLVSGSYLPSSASLTPTPVEVNQYVAGVEGTLEALNLQSSIKTGILPYTNPSKALERRRRT